MSNDNCNQCLKDQIIIKNLKRNHLNVRLLSVKNRQILLNAIRSINVERDQREFDYSS